MQDWSVAHACLSNRTSAYRETSYDGGTLDIVSDTKITWSWHRNLAIIPLLKAEQQSCNDEEVNQDMAITKQITTGGSGPLNFL